jgi:hypothetical protein
VDADHSQVRGLPLRKGLEWKAHRKRMGASEDLERKARFFCLAAGKKMRQKHEKNPLS